MSRIHPTAIIDPQAELAEDVIVGAYSVIDGPVRIDSGCEIKPHVSITGRTRLGKNNRIFQFASIGEEPQDKKYHGEDTEVVIGDGNTIRECVTINRGTADDAGITHIGNDNWIMAYVHIAHDCQVGDHNIFANNASLAGHVHIGDHVILGGFSLLHQFTRVGDHAFTSMGSGVQRDVPPFVMAQDHPARPRGLNLEGLRRRGFDSERVSAIKKAYRLLYKSDLPLTEALLAMQELAETLPDQPAADVQLMVDFIRQSKRSIVRG